MPSQPCRPEARQGFQVLRRRPSISRCFTRTPCACDRLDAVKHLVLCRIERRPPKLDLDIYPYLPRANVATTAALQLYELVGWRRVMTDSRQVCWPITSSETADVPARIRQAGPPMATEGADHVRDLGLGTDRVSAAFERRIRQARFAVKSLDSFASRIAQQDAVGAMRIRRAS